MAKQDQHLLETDADAAAGEVTEEQPKGKGRFGLILIPLLLLAVAGGATVAFTQYPTLVGLTTGTGSESDSLETAEEKEPIEYGEFTEIENLIVNPAGSEGRRYLMVKIGLESNKSSVLEEITAKQVVVRDTLLKVLSLHTVSDLASIEKRTEIKEELRRAVNAVVRKGAVNRLYFTEYVLQ